MPATLRRETFTDWGSEILVQCRPAYQNQHDFILVCIGLDEEDDEFETMATRFYPAHSNGRLKSGFEGETFLTADFRGVLESKGYNVINGMVH